MFSHPQLRIRHWVFTMMLLAGIISGCPSARSESPRPARPTDYVVVANYLSAVCRYVTWPEPPSCAVIELPRTGNNIRHLLNSAALAAQGLQPTPGLLENPLRRIGGPTP